jgi:hypothetical protein
MSGKWAILVYRIRYLNVLLLPESISDVTKLIALTGAARYFRLRHF